VNGYLRESQQTVAHRVYGYTTTIDPESCASFFAWARTIQPGPISNTGELERLLAACWDELTGDDGGMEAYKLLNRMEDVAWNPPLLTFVIERHGGTARGQNSGGDP
jgi:hypothetical protein